MKQKLLHLTLFFLLVNYGLMAQLDSVNMTAFNGVSTDRGVELVWTTDGEHNVEGFLLERSLDAISFEEVISIKPQSDGGLHKEYYYDDENIFRQHVYYRITTLMPSGDEYSSIIAVSRNNMDLPDIMIYPTITSQEINIVKNSTENLSSARVRVFNMSGNLLIDKPVNGNFLVESIDVSGYDAGAYVVELYNGEFAMHAKFIKQH
jgi:hypothetical protein